MKLRFLILSVAICALFANYNPVSGSGSEYISVSESDYVPDLTARQILDKKIQDYKNKYIVNLGELDVTENNTKSAQLRRAKENKELREKMDKLLKDKENGTSTLSDEEIDDILKDDQIALEKIIKEQKLLDDEMVNVVNRRNELEDEKTKKDDKYNIEDEKIKEEEDKKKKDEDDKKKKDEDDKKKEAEKQRVQKVIGDLERPANSNLSKEEYNNLPTSKFTLTLKNGVWEYAVRDNNGKPIGHIHHVGDAEAANYMLKRISNLNATDKLADDVDKFCKAAGIKVDPTPPATDATIEDAKAPLVSFYEKAKEHPDQCEHSPLLHGESDLGLKDMTDKADWGNCYDDPKKWKDHTPDCFRLINENNFAVVPEKILKDTKNLKLASSVNDKEGKFKIISSNIAKIPKAFTQLITAQDVLACQSEECLSFLAYIMKKSDMIKAESFNHVNGVHLSTWAHLVKAASSYQKDAAEYVPMTIFNLIPEAQLRTFGPVIVNGLGHKTFDLSDQVLRAVLSNPMTCAALKTSTLSKIMRSPKAKLLNSDCLAKANLKGVEIVDKNLTHVLKDSFSKNNACLSKSLTKALSINHVEGFAKEIPEALRRGHHLNFDNIAATSVKGITQAVFIGKLAGKADGYQLFTGNDIKNRWSKNLSTDILKNVSSEDMINSLVHMSSNDIEAFPQALLQTLVKDYPRLCALLPAKKIYSKIDFSNAECARYMTPEVQALTLATAEHIADDFLAYVDATSYEQWALDKDVVKSKRNDNFDKVTIFDAKTPERKNIEKVIANFGTKADGTDPCTLIPSSVSDIAEGKNLSKYITVKCYNKVAHDIPEDTKGIPERFHLLKSYVQLKKDPNFKFETLTQQKMADLSTGGAFCSFVEKENFDKIPAAALSGVSSHCVSELSFVDQLSKDQVAAMPGNAFEHIPANRINAQIIGSMTAAQLSHAASKVSDVEQGNIGALLVYSVMEQFDTAKLAGVTSAQWAKVPADSFRAINSAEKLKAIIPGSMEHWTADQVKQAPNDIWAALTIDQAKSIGSKAPEAARPNTHLLSMSGLSDEVREELRRGVVELPAGLAPMTIVIIVVGSVAVLALIGLGVWYFMRK